jgi:hypothetical protein
LYCCCCVQEPSVDELPSSSTREQLVEQQPRAVISPSASADVVASLESIRQLTVGQLKDILRQNFVSISGCLEKDELVNKVQLLYHDTHQSNHAGKQQQQQQLESSR